MLVPTLFSGCGRVRSFPSSIFVQASAVPNLFEHCRAQPKISLLMRSHHHELLLPKQEQAFIRFIAFRTYTPFCSFSPALAQPQAPTRQKTTPALRFQRRQPTPSLRYAAFRLPLSATLAPLATARASPSIKRANTPLRYAIRPPAFGRLRAALPALFLFRPRTAPDHPPLIQLNSSLLYAISGRTKQQLNDV